MLRAMRYEPPFGPGKRFWNGGGFPALQRLAASTIALDWAANLIYRRLMRARGLYRYANSISWHHQSSARSANNTINTTLTLPFCRM